MKAAPPADAVTILQALQGEMELYLRTGMRISPGRLALWLRDVREAAKECSDAQKTLGVLRDFSREFGS